MATVRLDELCPWCDAGRDYPVIVVSHSRGMFIAQCSNCGGRAPHPEHTERGALDVWNIRREIEGR